MKQEVLRIEGIDAGIDDKQFIQDIRINIFQNEAIALFGLEDSGKSILIKVLAGELMAVRGNIYVNDKKVVIQSRSSALSNKIYYIGKENNMIEDYTVSEHLFILRNNNLKKIIVTKRAFKNQANQLLKMLGVSFNADSKESDLTQSQKHFVELAKAVGNGVKVIIFDDILTQYSQVELLEMHEAMKLLKKQGIVFLLCGNNLKTLLAVSDKVVIMRSGRIVKKLVSECTDEFEVGQYMMGIDKNVATKALPEMSHQIVYELQGIKINEMSKAFTVTLKKGEILGIININQEEQKYLFEIMTGGHFQGQLVLKVDDMKISYKKKEDLIAKKVVGLYGLGMGNELLYNMTDIENIFLPSMRKASNKFGFLSRSNFITISREFEAKLSQKEKTYLKDLNRSRKIMILLERWKLFNPKVMILYNPMSIIDIFEQQILITQLYDLAKKGTAIILVESDVRECLDICHRIITIANGSKTGEFNRNDIETAQLNQHLFYEAGV